MPTNITKGNHGHNDDGSSKRAQWTPVAGTGVDPEVVEMQSEAAVGDGPWKQEREELQQY